MAVERCTCQASFRAALALAAPTAAPCGRGLQRPPSAIEAILTFGDSKLLESFRGLNNSFSYGSMQATLLRPTSSGAPIVAIEGAVYTALGPMDPSIPAAASARSRTASPCGVSGAL